MAILISDANPIQFWRSDCDTWNESSPEGIFHKKFCQPWNCDDTVRIEFTDVLSDDTNFQTISFPALSTFQNRETGADVNWTTGASPSISLGAGTNSELLYKEYAFIAGSRYKMTFNITHTSSIASSFRVRIYDSSFNFLFSSASTLTSGTTKSTVVNFIATTETVYVAVSATTVIGVDITINSLVVQVPVPDEYHLEIYNDEDAILHAINFSSVVLANQVSALYSLSFMFETYDICDEEVYLKIVKSTGTPDIEVAKSDALDVRTSHTETVLINYSNHRNFAGLYYSSVSPDQEFYIRIPAVFNKMRFPQEGEDLQLSSNRVIALNSQMKVQKRLSTGKMPSYMHLKMTLILMHQTLYIQGQYWVKGEESYEMIESPRTDPFEKYFVWLTQKEYVVRNIL